MSTAALLVSILSALFTGGSLYLNFRTRKDNKIVAEIYREKQPLQICLYQESRIVHGLQTDETPSQFDRVIIEMIHKLISKNLSDLETLLADRSHVFFIEDRFVYSTFDIVGTEENLSLFKLHIPVFEFSFEDDEVIIIAPKIPQRDQLVFHSDDWDEVRVRINNYVKGKKIDSNVLKMRFSENIPTNRSKGKYPDIELIIKSSI